MANKRKIDYSKMDLPSIVLKATKSNTSFSELGAFERDDVFRFMDKHQIAKRVFGKKWYDVLSNKFYAVEYLPSNQGGERALVFDSFGAFYESVGTEIYEQSCFYGYRFSNEEIERHRLWLSKINFDSFISNTVDSFAYGSLAALDRVRAEKARSAAKRFYDSIKDYKDVRTLDDVLEAKSYFCEGRAGFRVSDDVLLHELLSKDPVGSKDALVSYFCVFGMYNGLEFLELLLAYGAEIGQTITDGYIGTYSETSRRKKKTKLRKEFAAFKAGNYSFKRQIGFSESDQLFFVHDFYKLDQASHSIVKRYFFDFYDLSEYVGRDFRGVDLSKAPIDASDLSGCITDETTVFPLRKESPIRIIEKRYKDNAFHVKVSWRDSAGSLAMSKEWSFQFFFDLVHFLKGDLSDGDFIMCDGIENIKGLPGLNIKGIKVRSRAAEALGLLVTPLPKNAFDSCEFEVTEKNEVATVDAFLAERDLPVEYESYVAYVSDIHLPDRIKQSGCASPEDVTHVLRTIAKSIRPSRQKMTLIAGDTSNDFGLFSLFLDELADNTGYAEFFFVLGNHEFWSVPEITLPASIAMYQALFQEKGKVRFHLVHNNLFLLSGAEFEEIGCSELESMTNEALREKCRSARMIVFGGTGFAGMNSVFNSSAGLYGNCMIGLEDEKEQSALFLNLYEKVVEALGDRPVIVLTHMPMRDWGGENCHHHDGFIYVSGHTHRNYAFDDGKTRIYADNQIGYKGKRVALKSFGIDPTYDWFADYADGIHPIDRDDYIAFYRGLGETVSFNWQYEKLYMIKREGSYMFLMETPKGALDVLNGGARKSAGDRPVDYFYENLPKYSESVKMFLSSYDAFQKRVSAEIKSFGGSGKIHGCIIDIDYFNHVYINPLDGTITPYSASSMVDKYVYPDMASLLMRNCGGLFDNYKKLIEMSGGTIDEVVLRKRRGSYDGGTEIYRASRVIKGLQFTTKYSIVRLWNDHILDVASEENGRLIVTNLLGYEKP